MSGTARVSRFAWGLFSLSWTSLALAQGEAREAAPTVQGEPVDPAPAAPAEATQAEPSVEQFGLREYEEGLAARRLAPATALSTTRLREELARAEGALAAGRVAEAISNAAALVESSRFEAFRESPEGRGLRFVLGDALGRAGAYATARKILGSLVNGKDVPARRAVRALVDHGLESGDPAPFLESLGGIEARLPEDLAGDVAYARGRAHEKAGRLEEALGEFAKVGPRSRFWAQATYLTGLIEAERGRLKQAEASFCKVADPKLTPRVAPIFGGDDFFEVRDLARLGLGRVAHEQYRFDDAQYYYYLVPRDSKHLPEALYEAATARYEAKDHEGARQYLDELVALGRAHPYEDERFILDAYVDLAICRFDSAEKKLDGFLRWYVPVQNATRRLLRDPAAVRRLLAALEQDSDPSLANLGIDPAVLRRLAVLIKVDEDQVQVSRRLQRLERQLEGLQQLERELVAARTRVGGEKTTGAVQPPGPLGQGSADRIARLEAQAAEIGRLLREAESAKRVSSADVAQLRGELESLLLRVRQARAALQPAPEAATTGAELDRRIEADRARLATLREQALAAREALEGQADRRAKDVLRRLDRRLTRLLRRARMGRIELVLGKKRALEVEIEALSQGLLPPSMVDSLDVARYLRDDEEYWPDDGEDWADEYVGGEGLRNDR